MEIVTGKCSGELGKLVDYIDINSLRLDRDSYKVFLLSAPDAPTRLSYQRRFQTTSRARQADAPPSRWDSVTSLVLSCWWLSWFNGNWKIAGGLAALERHPARKIAASCGEGLSHMGKIGKWGEWLQACEATHISRLWTSMTLRLHLCRALPFSKAISVLNRCSRLRQL